MPMIIQHIEPIAKTTKPQPVVRAPRFSIIIIGAMAVGVIHSVNVFSVRVLSKRIRVGDAEGPTAAPIPFPTM